jgi:hypothetical protein
MGVCTRGGATTPHPDATSTHTQTNAGPTILLTTAPPTLVAEDGQHAPDAGAASAPPVKPAWHLGWSVV